MPSRLFLRQISGLLLSFQRLNQVELSLLERLELFGSCLHLGLQFAHKVLQSKVTLPELLITRGHFFNAGLEFPDNSL